MAKNMAARIGIIEALRGVASISVALFHFCGQLNTTIPQLLHSVGWVGVDMFFIISGFVIPYSIVGRGYSLANFPLFMARRLVRLEPPYLLSIVLVIMLWHVSTQVLDLRSTQPLYSLPQIGFHLFYIIPFTSHAWLSPVYWSLAYEFVFYILVGLLFPSLIARNVSWTAFATAVVIAISFAIRSAVDVRILEFFLGIITMRITCSESDTKWECAWLGITLAFILLVGGLTIGIASLATIVAILAMRQRPLGAWAVAVGSLSYSLYLTHTTIGGRVINLGKRFGEGPGYELMLVVVALAVSIAFAIIFFALIEKPAIAASRKFTL